ncbi:MAG: MerR family transcriptional regulator [Candidatus Babeliales bacterium]
MHMEERHFRIGQLAKELSVERFVIRFWEKEFGLSSHRSSGGQRFYIQKDLDTFKLIKQLLYERGFTIAGAKKFLITKTKDPYLASQKTTLEPELTKQPKATENNVIIPDSLRKKLTLLQKQLMTLRELL